MKILIIDNQYTQYEQLKSRIEELDRAKKEFVVLPEDDENFKSLMTSIKVFIYYGENKSDDLDPDIEASNVVYRMKSWKQILSYVNDCDLILMDYRLGSSLTCMTGLELSLKIWEEKDVPILILSRDEQTREDIFVDWTKIKKENATRIEWLVKGYWGAKLLPRGFVEANIIPTVRKLRESFVNSKQVATLFDELADEMNRLGSFKWSNNKHESLIKRLNYIVSKKPAFCVEELKELLEPLRKQTTTRLNEEVKKQIETVIDKYDRETHPGMFTES